MILTVALEADLEAARARGRRKIVAISIHCPKLIFKDNVSQDVIKKA
jgi:hypothetical protein